MRGRGWNRWGRRRVNRPLWVSGVYGELASEEYTEDGSRAKPPSQGTVFMCGWDRKDYVERYGGVSGEDMRFWYRKLHD